MAKQYENFYRVTGYGTAAGLGGPNCRHSFYPFFEGSKPSLKRQELDAMNNKTVTYNGEELSQDKALAIQRTYERNVRRWKREEEAFKGVDTEAGKAAQSKAKAKVSEYQGKLRDFTKQTGFKRDYTRERM